MELSNSSAQLLIAVPVAEHAIGFVVSNESSRQIIDLRLADIGPRSEEFLRLRSR
jgi:hypothetical protein